MRKNCLTNTAWRLLNIKLISKSIKNSVWKRNLNIEKKINYVNTNIEINLNIINM